MISESYISEMRARLRDVAHAAVRVVNDSGGSPQITADVDGHRVDIRVMRDLAPAADGDVRFVGSAFSDVPRLLEAIGSRQPLSAEEDAEISRRLTAASPGPWTAFIESDGGQGGCDVIRVSESDDEPDMYLWAGRDLAPSPIFRFVAAARQDIPELLATARSRRAGPG